MCIDDACCERFWASLCKNLCTCIFVLAGIIALLAGYGIMQDDSIEKVYAYGVMGGGGACFAIAALFKCCCADAFISKEGRVYQAF